MIKVSQLVDSQLSDFFRQEYPTFVKFFEEYYKATEIDGASTGILRQIQKYQNADFYKDGIILETTLANDISANDTYIELSQKTDNKQRAIWKRFPEEGLLLLDDGTNQEIIQYKSIDSYTGALSNIKRGSSGSTKLGNLLDDSTFISTTGHDFIAKDAGGNDVTKVTNISHLFLATLFKNLKTQYFSGIPIERLNQDITVPTILKYIKDFYASKGTSPAIEFLFRSAFNDEKILVRYPNEQLLKSSVSTWSVDTILQGTLIKFGDNITVDDLPGLVLKQITYGYDRTIGEATASIEKVIPIRSGNDILYRIFLNAESVIGYFQPTNETRSNSTFGGNNKTLIVDSTVGFPEINGEFYVEGINDADDLPISFSYAEKTGTEFYDVSTNAVNFSSADKNSAVFGSNILYVVSDQQDDPLKDGYSASFRPAGLISNIPITGKGLFVKEGDVVEFGLSGKKQDSPINSSWRQNVPETTAIVKTVSTTGNMKANYLQAQYGYEVVRGVTQVFENDTHVFVSSNGFPDVQTIGKIKGTGGPHAGLFPASQRHLKKIPKSPSLGKTKVKQPDNGTIGVTVDGVPIISLTGQNTELDGPNEQGQGGQLTSAGELSSITVVDGGVGYTEPPKVVIDDQLGTGAIATAEISGGKVVGINLSAFGAYRGNPEVTISSGSGAKFNVVIPTDSVTGEIESLDIIQAGINYTQVPEIVIVDESGRGRGAKFVVDTIDATSGSISAIRKVSGGYDYNKGRYPDGTPITKVYIVPTSSGATARGNVTEWHRDNIKEYVKYSDNHNGYPFPGLIPEYHDAYYYVGNPIGIRDVLNDNRVGGAENRANLTTLEHSPIIGWAYDGVPIYGPVGYEDPLPSQSGDYDLKRLESSYFLKTARNSTGVAAFPMGYFVEDYDYKPDGDPLHQDLDEFNGRFCETPDFPLGRYCYFTTVHESRDPLLVNKFDVAPRFPYIVGPTFKYAPEESNWQSSSILKNLPSDVIRVRDVDNNLPQFGSLVNATVSNVSPGSVDSVIIENGGQNWIDGNQSFNPKWGTGDRFYVDNTGTQGSGFSAEVSSILPKTPDGEVVHVGSISAADIVGKIDSRQQRLEVPSPSIIPGTNRIVYNRISEGDEILDNTIIEKTYKTSVVIGKNEPYVELLANNIDTISAGMTLNIDDEIVYVNGVPVDNTKFLSVRVSSTEQLISDLPITTGSQKGFYYQYINGSHVYDEIYVDRDNVSYKIGKIIELDRVANTMQLEMYPNPLYENLIPGAVNRGLYYTLIVNSTFNASLNDGAGAYEHVIEVADVGGYGDHAAAALYNAEGSGSRFSASIQSPPTTTNLWGGANNYNYFGDTHPGEFAFSKQVPVVRGWDATKAVSHETGIELVTQIPEGIISDYIVRITVSNVANMDAWNVGTYVKGATSQCEGRIVKIEKSSDSTGYLWLKDIKGGPNAGDLPRFGYYNSGVWNNETVNEIGVGATNTIDAGVVTSYDPITQTNTQLTKTIENLDTILHVANPDAFPIDRYIAIGVEKMRIVSRDLVNKTWTVDRRALGSSYPTSGSHLSGTVIEISNAQADFTGASDKYYATVDLYNAQRFTNSSTFKDQDDQNIDVVEAVTNPITASQRNITFGPSNFGFFNLGNIVKIGTEFLRLDAVGGNIFNATRGYLGSTAQEHAHDSSVTNQSELQATLSTIKKVAVGTSPNIVWQDAGPIEHGLTESDLIEIFGDPAVPDSQDFTSVEVKFDGTANRFRFKSVHTNDTFESNPNLDFVYGHKYIFDVSDISNQTTILSFYLDDVYTSEQSVKREGTPGNANATVTLQITNTSISNLFYDNSNSSITDSNPKVTFIEDPYNIGGSSIFNVTSTTFDYIVKKRVEGAARGDKYIGVVTPNNFGEIANVNIINQGFGYESLPIIKGISLRDEDKLDYTLTIDEDNGEITGCVIKYGGKRYLKPTIYIIGNGSGAKLIADTLDGSVRSIRVENGGLGYSQGTELLLVEEDENNIRVLPSSSTIGKVIGLSIVNPGARFSNNYTMVPETTIPTSMQLVNLTGAKKYEFGERVYQGDVNNPLVTAVVVDYNEINQTIRVKNVVGQFLTGQILNGYLSGTTSVPRTVNSASIQSTIEAITSISGFFSDDLGKLSTSSQKIQDSYFYQDFSYVIRSQIPVSDWREIIKNSTHPAGFLVFGEVILDSSASVTTVPLGGSTSCPPNIHKFTFNTKSDIHFDPTSFYSWGTTLFLRNGENIKVGDSFKFYQDSFDYELEWKGITVGGDIIEGKLVDQKIYYITDVENDGLGNANVKISLYHPNDTFADAEHNRERFDLSLQPTLGSYLPNFTCDSQNPQKQITIEVFKQFIEIDPTIPMELTDSLKTVQINKFFRMVERPGMGSLISAEGTVAIDLSYVDDITANIDGIKKIYDIREEGSLITPWSDNSLLVTIDGVGQEPGKAFTIINDRKIESLEITSTGAGSLEYDSWKITSGTTDIDNGVTVVSGTADVQQVYKDEEFIYITSQGLPSYKATIGPYSGLNPSIQDYIKRVPTKVFAPVDKQITPLGVIGMFVNGTLVHNSTLETTYNNKGFWTITEVGSKPLSDEFGGKANNRGQYYQACNPIGLRRQLNDNMTSSGDYEEDVTSITHSPVLGWMFDGTPIYGPYGYTDPDSAISAVKRIESGYSSRQISSRNTTPDGTILVGDEIGPPVDSVECNVVGFVPFTGDTAEFVVGQIVTQVNSQYDDTPVPGVSGVVQDFNPQTGRLLIASVNGVFSRNMWVKSPTAWGQIGNVPIVYNIGYFVEDYIYSSTGADLDVYNGRFCVTPEFPDGRYCYFATIRNSTYNYTTPASHSAELNAAYPFIVGPNLYHKFYEENQLTKGELASKIVFADPPSEVVVQEGNHIIHTQTQKFVARKFGFSDVINNKNFSKKFVDISPQFDGYKTTFQLQYNAQQPNHAPADPIEPSENALVFMDGIIQIPGSDKSYTIDDVANTITFSTPPKRIGKLINMSEIDGILNFRENEIVVGETSGATGKIINRTPLGYEGKGVLKVEVLTKDFIDGENITAPAVSGDVEPRTGKNSAGDIVDLGNINVSAASYDPNTGEMILTVSDTNHLVEDANGNLISTPITTGDVLNIRYKSITFTCYKDQHQTEHSYPRAGDPAHRQNLNIIAVGSQTLTVNVGISPNTTTHLFVNASNPAILVNGKTYGRQAISTPIKLKGTVSAKDRFLDAANLLEVNKDLIAEESVLAMLDYPAYKGSFSVASGQGGNYIHRFESGVTNAITANDGSQYTAVTNTTYNPETGFLTLDIGSHTLTTANTITIDNGGLTFSCAKDNNATPHTYPRATDPASGQSLAITSAVGDTITVNVGSTQFNNQDCIDDVKDVISAVIDNIRFGGNDEVYDAADLYVNGGVLQHLVGEEEPSKLAFRWAKDLCVLAMQNKLNDYNKLGTATGYSTIDNASTNKMIDGANLIEWNKDLIAHEAVERMSAQYPSYTYPTGFTSDDCLDDIKDTLDCMIFNMTYGGNSKTWDAANFYAKGISNYVSGRETEIVYAFNAAKDIASEVCRNILVNITGSHGFTQHTNATITDSSIETFTPTAATYNPTSGEMILTIANHGLTSANTIEIDTDSLEFTCSMDNNATKHTYPRVSDPVNSKGLEILNSTTDTITINVGSSPLETYDISNASYNETSGDMVLTIGNHNFIEGSGIKLAPNSLTFTCLKDFNVTNHTYPRTSDPVYDKSISIDSVGTFKYTVTDADYNPETGIAKLTVPSHPFTDPTKHTANTASYNPLTGELTVTVDTTNSFKVSDMIRIAPNSMFFTCSMDANDTQHSYPRLSDPVANKWLPISSVTPTSFIVNVGTTNINGYGVLDSTYDPSTGDLTLDVGSHSLDIGTSIRIAKDSLRFTCGMDNNDSYHTYPRSTDPVYNKSVKITGKTSNTITVNVGSTPLASHNVTDATYDTTSGNMQLEIGSHTLQIGESIRLQPESLTFSCAFNGATGAAAEKAYPRATGANTNTGADYAYNTAVEIISVTATKITVNVNGGQGAISNSDVHTFVSATSGAVVSGGNYPHTYVNQSNTYTPSNVSYNPTTGIMTLTVNDHKFGNGDHIRIADNSITMSCTHGSGNKTYPRVSDPVSGKWIPVSNVTTNTFDVQVLDIVPSTNTTVHTFVSAQTNCIERAIISTGGNYSHTFVDALAGGIEKATQLIRLEDNALMFQCGMDDYETNHNYPRPSDPYSSRWIPVSGVDGNTFDIQIGPSPNKSPHKFITAEPNSLHTPDGTITINVGTATLPTDKHAHTFVSATTGALISGGSYTHTFTNAKNNCITARTIRPTLAPTDAAYDPNTGVLIITSKNHGLSTSDRIRISPDSLNFTCSMDSNSTVHSYPRKSDPVASAVIPVASVTDPDTFVVNVGASPTVSHNVSNASYNHITGNMILTIGNHSLSKGTTIKLADNSLTFTCTKDGDSTNHSYPRTDLINKDIDTASYNPVTGMLSVTSSGHGFSNGDTVKIADNSITMKCLMDGNSSNKNYPRSTDPISGKWVEVQNSLTDTFDIFVGKSPLVKYTPGPGTTYDPNTGIVVLNIGPHNLVGEKKFTPAAGTTYDPSTGIMSVTHVNHGLIVGDQIRIAPGAVTFTCLEDNDQTEHAYPRSTDPVANKVINVLSVTDDTFDVQVLDTVPSTNVTDHTFVSGIANSITKAGHSIKLAADALKFTCAKDNHATFHTYPRPSDPSFNTAIDIKEVTDTTITIQVLDTVPSTNTSTHIFIEATADSVIAGGNYVHSYQSSLSGAITHKKDKSYDNAVEIIQDGSTHTVTDATYNPITGKMIVTVPTHGFSNGDNIKFDDGSIQFTCEFDATNPYGVGQQIFKSYPRPTDPYSNKWLSITKIDDSTFEVFVGKSSNTTKHTFNSATTDGLTRNNGQITINVGVGASADQYPHTFVSATAGAVISGGNYTHSFVSAYSNAITVLSYDTNDCADVVSAIASLNSIVTNAITTPSSLSSVVRTTPNAYPLRYTNKDLLFDNNIAIDPASRNYTTSCADVASSISTLMNIIINTIDNPTSLASVIRTPKRSYVEKKGIFQEFFAYSNGKYAILDQIDITSSTTTFVMTQEGTLVIPNISEQIVVTVNGVIQEFGKSYVVNESLIEFYKPIAAGSDLQIIYWYGRDLEKVLKGYNVPLYEPSYIKRDSNGNPILFTTESGIPTNKRIRTLPLEAYPIYEFFRKNDFIKIDGEKFERKLVDLSNRDIIEWEKKIDSNLYTLDAATGILGSPVEIRFETYNNQSTSGFVSGTKVVYDSNGNSDIPGLTNGTTYYIGYTYTTRGVRLFDNYLDSIGGGANSISISPGTGVHKFALETDLSGLKQTQFKTSDYTGEIRGREATFTARVRFTMVLSDSTAYTTPGTVMFSGGQSVASVVADKGNNKVEVQIYPDRILNDGDTIATSLGNANAVTMTSKENGYVYEVDSLSGSFPTGLDYDTAPILVIKAAETDTGGFARAHAEIDQNKQISRCIVDFPGEQYFQVPEVLVTRAYKHITQTYPLALVRNQYNFWSSHDTTLRTTMVLDAKQLTVSFDNTVTTQPVQKAGQEVTIFRTDEIVDDLLADDSSRVYDYNGSTDPAFPTESASGIPNQVSIGNLKLFPTFQSLEENKFNVDNTLTIGALDDKFGSLRIKDVSDRFYSSLYEDTSVAGYPQIRFDATCHTMIREFAGKFSVAGSIGNSFINLEGVQGFNYMTVEGNTFWLTEDMAIYEERTFVIVGYVDKIIDSNTFILRLNVGQNLLSGTNISNVANTVMVSIASQVSGEIETGKERLAYDQIDWVNKRLLLTQPLTHNYNVGESIRTARPIRLGST